MNEAEQHIFDRVTVSTSGCWEWKLHVNTNRGGYGQVRYRGSMWSAHRLAYTIFKGAIGSGLVVDHLCSNRPCCNPDHLELVTQSENNRRNSIRGTASNQNVGKDRCPKCEGPYHVMKNGKRGCRPCFTAYSREWRRKRKATTDG